MVIIKVIHRLEDITTLTSKKLLYDMTKLQVIVVRQEQQTKSLKMENSKLKEERANLKARLRTDYPKRISQTLKQKTELVSHWRKRYRLLKKQNMKARRSAPITSSKVSYSMCQS